MLQRHTDPVPNHPQSVQNYERNAISGFTVNDESSMYFGYTSDDDPSSPPGRLENEVVAVQEQLAGARVDGESAEVIEAETLDAYHPIANGDTRHAVVRDVTRKSVFT